MSNIQASDVSASVRSAFDFSVDKFPLYGPDNLPTDQYGLFRSDTGYIDGIKSISSRYVPHTTDDVCALVEAASTALDDEVECKTWWNRGHYVCIQPTRDHRRSIFGTDDNIFLRIMIRGGFDGKGFRADLARFRDACANLDIPRRVEGTMRSIPHTGNLRSRMSQLIDIFSTLQEGWDNMVNQARDMQSRDINLNSFLEVLYADQLPSVEQVALHRTGQSVKKVTIFNDMISSIKGRIVSERRKTGRDPIDEQSPSCIISGWEMYNAIQGYVQHDARTKKGFASEMARVLRASNDKIVRRAEELVLAS